MRKVLMFAVLGVFTTLTQPARAQFCPGAAPWVFDDVPASDQFCGFITWAAEHGITLGCAIIDANHRLYCPSDAVTRGQMAAFVNRLGNIRVEAVGTGPGLLGGPITSVGTISLAATQLLPTAPCAVGQVSQWSGSAWACAIDANSGGTVTSVGTGTGLTGGPVTTSGTVSIATGFQLPQGCAIGQLAKSNGSGAWTCAGDANSGGTVTSVATGAGLSGGPITASGTVNLAATQLLPTVACASNQVPSWNGSAWICAAPNDFGANINLQDSTSAAVGNITKPGGAFLHNFGTDNTFAGVSAGNFTMTGAINVAVGTLALAATTTGSANVAVGALALESNTVGGLNTASGAHALRFNTTGSSNTAHGTSALNQNTTGNSNVGIGAFAAAENTTGFSNVAVGMAALQSNKTGSRNTAVGRNALVFNVGDDNSALGHRALFSNTTGVANAAVGAGALQNNSTGSGNTAVGTDALASNLSDDNSALGNRALAANTTGAGNTAIGTSALASNLGDDNSALGHRALAVNTTGVANAAVGAGALQNNTTGAGNIAIGWHAGGNLNLGNNNVYIGHSGFAVESQTMRLGSSSQLRAFVAGVRGVTTLNNNAINVVIDSAGQLGTLSSSRNVKDDINDMGEASDVLMKLHPVTFRYKGHEGAGPVQYGLIAEEVAEVAPGLVAPGRDGEVETVYYQHLAPMLLNEYQKQRRTIDAQARSIDAQHAEIAELRGIVQMLMARIPQDDKVATAK